MDSIVLLIAFIFLLVGSGSLIAWLLLGSRGRSFKLREDLLVVTNLDAIMSRTIGFRYNGKVHKIKPLAIEKYVEAAAAMAAIAELVASKKRVKSEGQILDAYEAIFSVICPTINRSDLQGMSVQQIGALYNTVLEHIMGREQFEAQKKSPGFKAVDGPAVMRRM